MRHTTGICIAALASFLAPIYFAAAETRPNIIFFFTDDQAYDSVGCYGNPDVKTPHMDSLGAKRVIFDPHSDTTPTRPACRARVVPGRGG